MPHIHTEPGQHDMTVSAYIVRHREDGEWLCLVHMHRKIDMLMQVGGHIELDQTPWQAAAIELRDESGYEVAELEVLQWAETPKLDNTVVHPLPLLMNTHGTGEGHFHSDTCYGFVAFAEPQQATGYKESNDLRWLTLAELKSEADAGVALRDVVEIYEFLLQNEPLMCRVPANNFSLQKPQRNTMTYKRLTV